MIAFPGPLVNLGNIFSQNTLLVGILIVIIVVLCKWSIPKILERVWNYRYPRVYVNVSKYNFVRPQEGVINHYFYIDLIVENDENSTLTFSTPQFFVRNSSQLNILQPNWVETKMVIPLFSLKESKNEKIPRNVTINGTISKSIFNTRELRIEAHNLINDYVVFDLPKIPRFHSWRFVFTLSPSIRIGIDRGSWAIGKIVIKPVGRKPISKIIYIDKNLF